MENASKALIIAGAILLSILIIGLGMMIFNQAQNAMSGANLNSEAAMAFNSKFSNYSGTQSGTSARTLCDIIKSHNLTNTDDYTRQIVVQTTTASGVTSAPTAAVTTASVDTVKNTLFAGRTYKIDFGYDAKSGFIVAVGIVVQ